MIAVPSIALLGLMAMLSLIAATVLRKAWMQYVALGCAAVEIASLIWLVTMVSFP